MGIASSGGPNAPLSGGLANLIFYISGGRQLTRSKGNTGKNAKSAAVKSNRRGFGDMQLWLNPLKPVLELGFKNDKPNTGALAHAISYMSAYARTGKGATAVIHPENMRISIGQLPMPSSASATLDGENLVFNWDAAVMGAGASAYDQVLLAAYEVDQGFAVCLDQGLFRKDGGATMPLPHAGTYQVYFGLVAKDNSIQGDGLYLGKVVLEI